MPEQVKTGGTKEFYYTREDMRRISQTDTKPTLEFKKALAMHRFFQNIDDAPARDKLKGYTRFHDLGISAADSKGRPVKFTVDIGYEAMPGKYRHATTKKAKTSMLLSLPQSRYRLLIYRKYLLFFRKSNVKEVILDGRRQVTVRL